MTLTESITVIKSGLASVQTQDWNARVAMCLAVQTVESEIKKLSELVPKAPVPTVQKTVTAFESKQN